MRWDLLFADLEAALDATERGDVEAEIAERARDERAQVALAGRALAHVGGDVRIVLADGSVVAGALADAAGSWWLLDCAGGQVLVPCAAIAGIDGLGHAATAVGEVRRRMGLGVVLRELAESGGRVAVDTAAGRWEGVIAAVGADHLDLMARTTRAVPLAAILAVRSL
ncbi:hypothetical protein [Demequina iriomotensis]|uniref:hypothetical protein n=1 Tax=Demequina iriomotensis TaxID=1536641 RepID=UPI0007827798|nr:hypothetical protein [Demequina iriomotensis]